MLPTGESIELRTNDNSKVLRMNSIEKDAKGFYRCELFVRSGDFSCERPFYFDESSFPDAIQSLRRMDAGMVCETQIKAQWENDYIGFASDSLGHVFVTGEIAEYSDPPQSFRFAFKTDKTILAPLIRDFERLQSV